MNREEVLEKAWAECPGLPSPMNIVAPATAHWAGFESGFNAAWDALLAEIRPLVSDVLTFGEIKRALIPARVRHLEAVDRLRELVRQGELEADKNLTKLGDYKIHASLTERGNLRFKVEMKDLWTEFFVSSDLTVSSDE